MSYFSVHPMKESEAKIISEWTYTPPYDLYQFLPWSEMQALEIEFGDPVIRRQQYVSIQDEHGELCGFAQYFPMVGVIRIGLGMCPDLIGQGKGVAFVSAILKEALQRYPAMEIDLEVLTWNERAISVYQRCGFRITDTYERLTPSGTSMFHCMVYEEDPQT